jgi:hypothetical protein
MRDRPVTATVALLVLAILPAAHLSADGRYLDISYPGSQQPGELQFDVTYTIWIPDGVRRLRGIVVHQHGCGAARFGIDSARDLHWQALARKWDCALLGPSYQQGSPTTCQSWSDPRNGSDKAFLRALSELAAKSAHPELETAPWCLWGHSGGGYWSGMMQILHPERIVGVWCRSGTAYVFPPRPETPEAAYGVPVMCNTGAKEKDDKRYTTRIWAPSVDYFRDYRAKGAPVGFAVDPRTAHETGDSRYAAIPFLDACLEMRLPPRGSTGRELRPVDWRGAWLASLFGDKAYPAASYPGKPEEAVWLPNRRVAQVWEEYVKTGTVGDTTPPPAPFAVRARRISSTSVEVTWDAAADFESGIRAFVIERDGRDLAQVPAKPKGAFGRPLYQAMTFHDTPEKPLPEMRFVDEQAPREAARRYRVIEVNGVGLRSKPSKTVVVPASGKGKG